MRMNFMIYGIGVNIRTTTVEILKEKGKKLYNYRNIEIKRFNNCRNN